MLTSFVCLASATTTEIKAKMFMRVNVEEESWDRMEISSVQSHGTLSRYVSF